MRQLKSFMRQYDHIDNNIKIDEKTICHLFSRLVLSEYGRYGSLTVQPSAVKKNILYVKVDSSVWAQEIWIRRDQLRKLLNEKIGKAQIKGIVART